MTRPALARLLAAIALTAGAAACGGDKSGAAPGGSGSAAAARAATAPARAAAPKAPATDATTGDVELHEGKKKKVGFAIELPKGLKDVTEVPYIKQYAKEAKTFDGYSFQVMQAHRALAPLPLEAALALVTKEPDFAKNKARLLDKGTTDDGYYFAHTIQEGKKKAVLVTAIKKKGEVSLQCRGNVEGPLADKPEEAAAVIVAACKTLKITSS